MPLGAAKPRAVEAKPDPIREFETGDHDKVLDPSVPFFGFDFITEKDCRQIKGAAKLASREVAPSGRPVEAAPPSPATPVAVPTFKVGDRVRLKTPHHNLAGKLGAVYEVLPGAPTYYTVAVNGEGKQGRMFEARFLELILPSEPKADSEWVRLVDAKENLPAFSFELRSTRTGKEWPADKNSINLFDYRSLPWAAEAEYRLVKQQ